MDDRRFDSLTRAFASSTNRRTLIKTLLGLGGATAIGTVASEETDAATRPTPTPKPVTCPGQQTWNGTKCVCPANLSQCVPNGGPACCNDKTVVPGSPTYSTCCDNACCSGTCTSEEICCATNSRAGGLLPTNRICAVSGSTRCCLYSDECCTIDGCCSTTCHGGVDGKSYCCPAEDWCPGGSTSPERCCEGNTVCCGANTNGNICADLSNDNNNCGACGHVCGGCSSCQNGVCVADNKKCPGEGQICCPKNGSFACEAGPYCGCDRDSDCPGTNPATCQVGWCDRGTCKIKAAPNTTVCHPAGTGANAICDPAVMCNGESQSCPGPHYAQPGTDCGDCKTCNATGICTAKCTTGQDCCPASDTCVPHGATCCTADSQCTAPCQTCNEDLGYCVTTCTTGQACCTLGDGPECCATTGGSMCCPVDGCVNTKTDNNNCGACGHVCPGCSTCQNGLCTATNSKCTGEGQVCCKNGNTYTCEAGPYCGCDTDGDCSNLNNPANCQVGKCDHSGAVSVCVTAPAPNTTVCHPAGANATCDPAVMCSGQSQQCPGPHYAPEGTDCGDCMTCNGTGACNGFCTGFQTCCPGAVDYCIQLGSICCTEADDCPDSYCDGLTWHNIFCNVAGYCFDETQNCNDGNLCTNDFCNAATGCSHTPVTCTTPPTCFTGPGACSLDTGQCSYTPVVCNAPGVCEVGPGTCNPQTGLCSYQPMVCDTNQCLTCVGSQCVTTCPAGTHCNGAGQCVEDCVPGGTCDVDGDCCGDNLCCDGTCVAPDSECGQCLGTCTGASKCCCYHPDNGNYDCANVNGCDNGQGHYCVN